MFEIIGAIVIGLLVIFFVLSLTHDELFEKHTHGGK